MANDRDEIRGSIYRALLFGAVEYFLKSLFDYGDIKSLLRQSPCLLRQSPPKESVLVFLVTLVPCKEEQIARGCAG